MRILANSDEGRRVRQVLLDGRPILNVVELDTDEGWVKLKIPRPQTILFPGPPDPDALSEDDKEQNSVAASQWDEETRHGVVTVKFGEEKEDAKA